MGWGGTSGGLHATGVRYIASSRVWSQLEEELMAQIETWEQEHSKAFVVNGQKFMEYVAEQWEMHRLEKERAKQERVSGPVGGGWRSRGHPDPAGAAGRAWRRVPAPPPAQSRPSRLLSVALARMQQLKNRKQTEMEMLYGSAPRTPSKRRGLPPSTPGKVRKVSQRPALVFRLRRRGGASRLAVEAT